MNLNRMNFNRIFNNIKGLLDTHFPQMFATFLKYMTIRILSMSLNLYSSEYKITQKELEQQITLGKMTPTKFTPTRSHCPTQLHGILRIDFWVSVSTVDGRGLNILLGEKALSGGLLGDKEG